jgi:manganese/zinc/iron transport system ATP- binding protein
MTPAPIEVHDLTVAYRHRPVLWDIDFTLPAGTITAVVGPNGAGKSTLLKAILGLLPLASGEVLIYGKPVDEKRAVVAYVPQREEVDWDFPINVVDVVLMGRYGRLSLFKRIAAVDREIADNCLEQVGMTEFRNRQISQLSGGQQQRVFIARALAQQATIYLMDEPLAGVDAATERSIIALFQALRSDGKTVVCVHHDLNTVSEYFDHIVLLNQRQVAAGPAEQVLTVDNLQRAYGGRLGVLSEVVERLRKRDFHKRAES